MMIEIKVPQLGESVTEGTVVGWLKKLGDFVVVDEAIAEIETDKITMEINASASGKLVEIFVNEGETIAVGGVLGKLDTQAVAPTALKQEPSLPLKIETKTEVLKESILSPSAQKISLEKGLNPQAIEGTGKDGRITKEDVLKAPGVMMTNPSSSNQEERVKMTRLRQRIAERLKHSQNTAALLTTFNEVDMTQVMAIRDRHKDRFFEKHGVKLGFMSFFVRSVVEALKEIPEINAEIDGQDIIYKNYYNIGVAVGTEQGLVVPVVRNAEAMSLSDIERSIANYATKARNGSLTVDDLSGGTFTISNGGVYGSLMSTPIVNPPQSGILGLHKIQKRAVVINDTIQIRPMMYLALTYDHRIVDGKGAVGFLARVKEMIESPETLLLNV
jgi:2-oxoglutarate dehydrogenase E2 component (dihydrolipoamide succinyltransferase)